MSHPIEDRAPSASGAADFNGKAPGGPLDAAEATKTSFDPTQLSRLPAGLSGGPGNEAPDPFDPARLRLSQDFGATLGVREVLTKVPVRKAPSKEWFVRVRPGDEYRLHTMCIDLRDDREELYLVERELWPSLAEEPTFKPKVLVTAINRQDTLFVWHGRLPGPDGRTDDWLDTALDAMRRAESRWIKIYAGASFYRVAEATAEFGEPTWPDVTFSEILHVAFRDRHITSLDHPVLRRLRGDA